MKLTVHEVSKNLSVSPDTIRRWNKKGLIKATRSSQNYRLFDLKEVTRLYNKLNLNNTITDNLYKIFIEQDKSNYTGIDLFAGAGGMALGFENAGLHHLLLNEIDKNCIATLRNNFYNTEIIHDDINYICFKQYMNKIDFIQAGFPCQAFSYVRKSLGFEDTRGTLFFEFARAIKETNPKIAIGENVRGLINHDEGRTLQTMIKVLKELGYKVEYRLLKAQYLDVPQKRERLIILAIRNDLDIDFVFPQEKDYIVTLKDALKDCPPSIGMEYSERKKKILSLVPEGGYWKDLPEELQKEYMKVSFYHTGGRTGMARRLAWDEPSLTLTCSPAQKQTERCHPEETRPLNVREYARIQTFPDNYKFEGSMHAQYKQIGNAVPVNLGYHIGLCVRKMLDSI
ncbi:Type II methyltransferase M.Eco47II [Candidatus Xenohaliotis californiensis]|uniref:Cytosine-specific methyltransferase n=1 Tax=Candidatus Xenohaliotis californiensis TaxID=84677 RepID=A0ABM9N7T7_9RICK|nr:Type II methyltransferase M.Eco47II [Candidatus Xenohaliotis californiensis]